MKLTNVKLNSNGTVSYVKDGINYRTVNTIHELAAHAKKTLIVKGTKVNSKQLGDVTVIQEVK